MMNARRIVWLAAVACGMLFAQGPARAQILPQDLKIAQGNLSPEQQQQLNDFVDPLMEGLVAGDADAVSTARNVILREFSTPGATDSFKNAFSTQIHGHMADAMASDSDLVRINAMIIATQLTNPEAQAMIDAGLSDPNAAVQYWSAKAYREQVGRTAGPDGTSRLPGNQQRQIVERMDALIATEPAVPVVQTAFDILIALSVPEAQTKMLEILNSRVTQHVDRPQVSYRAEQEAIRQLSTKFARERRIEPADTQALLGASFRFFVLVNEQMKRGNVLPENQAGHKAMLDWCHRSLIGLASKEQGVQLPQGWDEVNDWIKLNQWDKLLDISNRWRALLLEEPFNVTPEQLVPGA